MVKPYHDNDHRQLLQAWVVSPQCAWPKRVPPWCWQLEVRPKERKQWRRWTSDFNIVLATSYIQCKIQDLDLKNPKELIIYSLYNRIIYTYVRTVFNLPTSNQGCCIWGELFEAEDVRSYQSRWPQDAECSMAWEQRHAYFNTQLQKRSCKSTFLRVI